MKRFTRRLMLCLGGTFALVIALLVLAIVSSIASQPSHKGKRLSVWLDELGSSDFSKRANPNSEQAAAVRAIGTNAIPWLLGELDPQRHSWQINANYLLGKLPFITFRYPDVNAKLARATLGFHLLGSLAEPAIPLLLERLEMLPGYIPGALAGIGPPAVPALQKCLTNTTAYPIAGGRSFTPIPGNTIGAIHNALNAGQFSKSNIAVLLPTIRQWAAQSTNPHAATYATNLLKDFER